MAAADVKIPGHGKRLIYTVYSCKMVVKIKRFIQGMMKMIDIILNLAIVLATPLLLIRFWRRTGRQDREKFRAAFRFFTVLSNILCSVTALIMLVALLAGAVPEWVWILKYIGTAAVTVTMLTVFLPVALYGPVYLYHILLAPEGKRWNDFYGFNRGGRWPAAMAGMLAGTFLMCLGIMALQNL